jgi:hypothetical protein
MTTEPTVPMITTKSIAASVCPNHKSASGIQQTLGSVCNPSASAPTVSWKISEVLVIRPSGKPMRTPIA